MPTPAERKALFFCATVALLGAGARWYRAASADAPSAQGRAALDGQIGRADSARQRKRSGRPGRQNDRSNRADSTGHRSNKRSKGDNSATLLIVDLDTASAETIEGLPYIGPTLAQRIAADRDTLGPFGSLDELARVRGISRALAAKLAPRVTFSLVPRPKNTVMARPPTPPKRRRAPRPRNDPLQ